MSLDVELFLDIDVGSPEFERVMFFGANYTHNICQMAEEAGLRCVWYPEEFDIALAQDLIPSLKKGIDLLRSDSIRFEALNPKNGWGDYESFVRWLDRLLKACEKFPKTKYYACR